MPEFLRIRLQNSLTALGEGARILTNPATKFLNGVGLATFSPAGKKGLWDGLWIQSEQDTWNAVFEYVPGYCGATIGHSCVFRQ